MSRLARLLALVLAACVLCGCASASSEQTVSCGELTITLPGTFQDLSGQTSASGLEFVYGLGSRAVFATKEDKSTLAELIENIDAMRYAELFVESNGLPEAPEVVDGIPCFTYSTDTGGAGITYLCGVFESESHFWVVQAYCASEDFAGSRQELWGYITSVIVA